MTDAVVVSGVGVVPPGGGGVDGLWEVATGTRDAFVPAASGRGLAATAPVPDRRAIVRTGVGRRIDRLSLMVLAAMREAIADAVLDDAGLAGPATGIVVGSAFGNFEETAMFLERLGTRGAGNPLVFPNLVMNASLSYASIELGATGPTIMVTEQEISGEAAVAAGLSLLAAGTVERCLVAAGDQLTPELHDVLREVGVLASGRPRVYDRAADGFVPGEGAAALVLESASAARARRAPIWARIGSCGEFGVPAPRHGWPTSPSALIDRIGPVVADAGLVLGCASGDPVLDALEAEILGSVLPPGVPITAPRARVGHFGSAGILSIVLAASAIRRRTLPPGPPCDDTIAPRLSFVPTPRPAEAIPRAVVLGMARGGACCTLTIEDESLS